MKKADYIQAIKDYNEYAKAINVHVIPTKGINSGAHGRSFETMIKMDMGNYRSKGVAKPGRADTKKKIDGIIRNFEIKQGCGELICYNIHGDKISDIRDKRYTIYTPVYHPSIEAWKQGRLFLSIEFYNLLEENGLVRCKKSTYMCKQPKEVQFYDRITIQSFNNSRKKLLAMEDIMTHGIPMEEVIATIKNKGALL